MPPVVTAVAAITMTAPFTPEAAPDLGQNAGQRGHRSEGERRSRSEGGGDGQHLQRGGKR